MLGNRWYDLNPLVSFAVTCIETADKETRSKLARIIIKHGLEAGLNVKRPSTGLFRRWYDKDKDLSLAMEYFKQSDNNQRRVIAEHIVDYTRGKNTNSYEIY